MNLVTRLNFDGMACAAILKEIDVINTWTFVHPSCLQNGIIHITKRDILANVPYAPGCALWFDHHLSEQQRVKGIKFKGESRMEKSTARIIYEHYGGKEKMPYFEEMVTAVDKVKSGDLSIDDIMEPKDWVLLGLIMDPRSGFGRLKNFKLSNYALMEKLIELCRSQKIDEIIDHFSVRERMDKYWEQNDLFNEMINTHSEIYDNVIVTDLRDVPQIYIGNRFLIYVMYPEQNISIRVVGNQGQKHISIDVGHNVLNRTSSTKVGPLLLQYGGEGHKQVGTCVIPYDECDKTLEELIIKMKNQDEYQLLSNINKEGA